MTPNPARLRPILMTIAALIIAATPATADVVQLKDGRAYEGEIIRRDSLGLRIDTMVTSTIRTQLTFAADEIEKVELRPLPKGFFDPPAPEPRVSEPEDFEPEVVLYIEVPIVGAFGTDVFAAGIEDVLRYARRHRIEHVVFMIDSDGNGIDEAGRAYDALKKYDRALEYHAIIKRCTGDALAIPIWCDTIRLLPGALVGGSAASMASEDASDAQESMVRTQIAAEISRDMGRRGRDPLLIRAMIDPTESLAGWRAGDGEVIIAPLAPVDIAPDQLIFRVDGDDVLVLDQNQAVALGLPRFDGSAKELGADLGFESWEPESRYELGLEPTFKPGELQFMADDVRTKYDELGAGRGRRGY